MIWSTANYYVSLEMNFEAGGPCTHHGVAERNRRRERIRPLSPLSPALRLERRGPRVLKLGNMIRYSHSDVLAYLTQHVVETKN